MPVLPPPVAQDAGSHAPVPEDPRTVRKRKLRELKEDFEEGLMDRDTYLQQVKFCY